MPNSNSSVAAADPWVPELSQDGCQFLRDELGNSKVQELGLQLDALLASHSPGVLESRGVAYGVRNVLDLWPQAAHLAMRPNVRAFVRQWLGRRAGVVRILVFDKPPSRSWTLPWHRDRTIAVGDFRSADLPAGFYNATRKSGVTHVHAPEALLQEMLTLRFSLDPMNDRNGQVVVLPGSHNPVHSSGALVDADLTQASPLAIRPIFCAAGDVFVMRPLLAHSSINSSEGTSLRRRVLHIELAGTPKLPPPLCWKHFVPI